MAQASVIDLKGATIVGTADRLERFLDSLLGRGAGVIDLKGADIVVLDDPITRADIAESLERTHHIREV